MLRFKSSTKLRLPKCAVLATVGVVSGFALGACLVLAISGGAPATTGDVLTGMTVGLVLSCVCVLGATRGLSRDASSPEEPRSAPGEFRDVSDEGIRVLSHEVKTHLNGILGTAEAMILGYYGDTDEEQRTALRALHQSAWNILRLVDSVVRYCRLGLGPPNEEEPTTQQQLYDHIEEILLDRWLEAEQTGVRIVNTVPRDLSVRYRRHEIERIVAVLLDNALRFTPQGTIEVLAMRWTVPGRQGFQLGVRDTGVGISPEKIQRIFEPFAASRSSTAPCIRGAGLGLASACMLARRFSGKILVESELGRGSTFTVLVPEGHGSLPLTEAFVAWPPRAHTPVLVPEPVPEGNARA